MMKKPLLVAALISTLSLNASAATVTSDPGTVLEFFVFSEFGEGDVGFRTSSPMAGCQDGYWLRPSDDGFKQLYAQLMMAYAMKSTIRVSAHNDSVWPGSLGAYCRVYWMNAQ